MNPTGYNPMRWDCAKRGCFNQLRRPKIEVFADCFPGRGSFGDVDGLIEIAGSGLLLEWKSQAMPLPTGQRIMYERLTKHNLYALIVIGDPETMAVEGYAYYSLGRRHPDVGYVPANLDSIKCWISAWVEHVKEAA